MSFRFNWPEFDEAVTLRAARALEEALNRGKKPSNICEMIRVKEFHMGSRAPELDILEIGELTADRFRGIFKLAYLGDGHIILETKVQANPLNATNFSSSVPSLTSMALPMPRPMLAADLPLVVPMQLKLSQLRLRAIMVLVVSRSKGVTLSFKTDPLESVSVSSTFDGVGSVKRHLQSEIETRLRDLFCDELPALLHKVSNDWIQARGAMAEGFDDIASVWSESFLDRLPPRKTSSPFPFPFPLSESEPRSMFSPQSVSVTAQSAPPDLHVEGSVSTPSLPDHSRSGGLSGEEHYFVQGNIVSRAVSSAALPDPVLVDGGRIYRKRATSIVRLFRSLFRIPEAVDETEILNRERCGLKNIGELGVVDVEGTEVGVKGADFVSEGKSFVSSSTRAFFLPRAFSLQNLRPSPSREHSESVQFEPEEFRLDRWESSSRQRVRPHQRMLSHGEHSVRFRHLSNQLPTKLTIRRHLSLTLALDTFCEQNVLCRSMASRSERGSKVSSESQ